MFALNFFKTFNLTKIPIGMKRNTYIVISEKKNYFPRDKIQCNLNHDEKYNECIKNGISSELILLNEWIFNLDISE